MIDHHENPKSFCDFEFSFPNKSSTCELIYDLMLKYNFIEFPVKYEDIEDSSCHLLCIRIKD